MIVLVDGDIVAYRCAAGAENEEDWVAVSRANNLIHSIIYESKATSALVYISGDNNFRKELCIEYKANRTKEKPKWLEVCREALVVEWGAKVVEGMEADDAIAIKATSNPDEYIMASLDKDFKQVPGWHYQWAFKGTSHGKEWVKEAEYFHVTPLEGLKFFYKQLLIGDESDNVKGVYRIGKKKADVLIDPCETELEMFNTVRSLYEDDERLLMNGRLLWLLREEDQVWQFPNEENEKQSPDIEVN